MSNSILAAPARLGKLALLSACISAAPLAQAAFVLEIDDDLTNTSGTPRVTIVDGGDGVVNYTGDFGSFTLSVNTGFTEPAVAAPVKLGLDSLEISGDAATLYIWLTNTDFSGPEAGFTADFGGTTQGTVDVDFLYDTANSQGGGAIFASGDSTTSSTGGTSFSDSLTAAVTPADPYSLTIFATIVHTGPGQVTSVDALITAVPVPAAAWLFGSALLGLGLLRRK